jgi:hypothetical protein
VPPTATAPPPTATPSVTPTIEPSPTATTAAPKLYLPIARHED